ncbi:HAD-IIIA family hydrolase [Streptomyces sp. NPDC127190]|uniref:D-glycero-alpha-D-manno-heptose-1,7-bisphosphate 7-phosphatase n=1 Tax=unclassified Streptomyces TaxID=2593676 RepID=UPI00362EDB29
MSTVHAVPLAAVLFDRDGTLVADVPYNGDPGRVRLLPGAAEAVALARSAGLATGVVSNQSGIGRGLLSTAQVQRVNARADALLGGLDTWLFCPHAPDAGCDCRKPRPGLILAAAARLGVPPAACLVIGDIATDVLAAQAAGARAVLVPNAATAPEETTRFAAVTAPDIHTAVRDALRADGRDALRAHGRDALRAHGRLTPGQCSTWGGGPATATPEPPTGGPSPGRRSSPDEGPATEIPASLDGCPAPGRRSSRAGGPGAGTPAALDGRPAPGRCSSRDEGPGAALSAAPEACPTPGWRPSREGRPVAATSAVSDSPPAPGWSLSWDESPGVAPPGAPETGPAATHVPLIPGRWSA